LEIKAKVYIFAFGNNKTSKESCFPSASTQTTLTFVFEWIPCFWEIDEEEYWEVEGVARAYLVELTGTP